MKRKYPVIDIVRTGQNIKRIMQVKGLTVKDVQEFLELSTPQSIYHWFEGRNLPTIDNLYALSELFEVPIDYLACGNRKYKGANNICSFNTRVFEYYIRFRNIA